MTGAANKHVFESVVAATCKRLLMSGTSCGFSLFADDQRVTMKHAQLCIPSTDNFTWRSCLAPTKSAASSICQKETFPRKRDERLCWLQCPALQQDFCLDIRRGACWVAPGI